MKSGTSESPKGQTVEKPKSPQAQRAVVKPKEQKPEPEGTWKGGVDHFGEEV